MFEAAVFDMDGLLLDSERPIRDAWMSVARDHGVAMSEEDYLKVVGRNAADTKVILGAIFSGDLTYDEARRRSHEVLAQSVAKGDYPVKPGAFELLSRLRLRGIPCCVASSTAAVEVRRRLERAGLLEFFGSTSGGDEVERGKPHPDLFLLASRRMGVEAARCLVFEDSEYGVLGAVAAGMSAVIVPDLKRPTDSTRVLCVAVLDSLEQALPLCEGWFSPDA